MEKLLETPSTLLDQKRYIRSPFSCLILADCSSSSVCLCVSEAFHFFYTKALPLCFEQSLFCAQPQNIQYKVMINLLYFVLAHILVTFMSVYLCLLKLQPLSTSTFYLFCLSLSSVHESCHLSFTWSSCFCFYFSLTFPPFFPSFFSLHLTVRSYLRSVPIYYC